MALCIGPVCIPYSAFIPMLLFLLQPVWKFLTRMFPVLKNLEPKAKKAKEDPPVSPAPKRSKRTKQGDGLQDRKCMVKELEEDGDFEADLQLSMREGVPLVAYFTAKWCVPCKQIEPVFKELAAKNDAALFVKVDVDTLEATAESNKIMAMPTFKVSLGPTLGPSLSLARNLAPCLSQIFKGGKVVDELKGADKAKLTSMLGALCR